MALTHVRIWNREKKRYQPISIEEAVSKYPVGVSYKKGIFSCSLCREFVTLTSEGVYQRHFRHSSDAQNKECEERQTTREKKGSCLDGYASYNLPLKIIVNKASFSFELGFWGTDDNTVSCEKIIIKTLRGKEFLYSYEDRVAGGGVAYLSVGCEISEKYFLQYENATDEFKTSFPVITQGVYGNGTLFNAKTGKMIFHEGVITSGEEYYFLTDKDKIYFPYGTDYEETVSFHGWKLYKILVRNVSKDAVDFFSNYFVDLVCESVDIFPVWPDSVNETVSLYSNKMRLYFYANKRDFDLRFYPFLEDKDEQILQEGKIFTIRNRHKKVLLSYGMEGAFGFSYLFKNNKKLETVWPVVEIKDMNGQILEQDIYNKLPVKNSLKIAAQYDGKIEIFKNDELKESILLKAEDPIKIDGIFLQTKIRIYQGLDVIREICFCKAEKQVDVFDCELVEKLSSFRGESIAMPHRVGGVVKRFDNFLQTQKWLLGTCKKGKISRKAYLYLNKIIKQMG